MGVRGLHILWPNGVQRVVDSQRLAERISNREWRSPRSPRRSVGIAVDGKRKGRTGSQPLIEGKTLKETGCAVAASNDELWHGLESEAHAGHDLFVTCVVARVTGANDRPRCRASRHMPSILYDTAWKDVGGLVVLFIPG